MLDMHPLFKDSLAEIRTLETDVTQYLDLTYKYFISRGELIKKVVKYPHVEDYRRSIQSLDEKQFVSMRFIALELRNHYASWSLSVRHIVHVSRF